MKRETQRHQSEVKRRRRKSEIKDSTLFLGRDEGEVVGGAGTCMREQFYMQIFFKSGKFAYRETHRCRNWQRNTSL